ncbi:MAG TPA: hypothetical protein VLK58_28020 [Conexibacter sp.]|nr:hypothetical protein [Conexibacter sp.]
MHPDWLGSPQHVVGGAVVAVVTVLIARRAGTTGWLLLGLLGLGVASLAEVAVELAEYFLRTAHATAYHDTVADLAATLVGAVLGTAAALLVGVRRDARRPA